MNILFFITSLFIDKDELPVKEETQSITRDVSAFKELSKPLLFKPESLVLELSNGNVVGLSVEEIELDSSGQLGTPKNWSNAGWYKKSALAGENGNVIIDGHYDTSTGAPAAFWPLKSLKVNDKVILKDKLNRSFTYEVNNTFYVNIYDPNRLEVFKESDNPTLTLITCGGLWDYVSGTYSKRLVVKANLISSDLD